MPPLAPIRVTRARAGLPQVKDGWYHPAMHEGEWGMFQFPKCRKCDDGELVPSRISAARARPIHFKAWVCTNPDCGYNIKIRNGELFIDEPINDGQLHMNRR